MKKISKKIIFNKAGGNASSNAYATKLSIPKEWLESLGVTIEDREVNLIFDEEKGEIIIRKEDKCENNKKTNS